MPADTGDRTSAPLAPLGDYFVIHVDGGAVGGKVAKISLLRHCPHSQLYPVSPRGAEWMGLAINGAKAKGTTNPLKGRTRIATTTPTMRQNDRTTGHDIGI